MIDRYTRPAMGQIWTDANKFRTWLRVEILVCEAWAQLGEIPQEAVEEIKEKASFDVDRIEELESQLHHDVVAFTTCVAERVGDAARFFHYGLTSSDVVDTSLSSVLREAVTLLLRGVDRVVGLLEQLAVKHRDTVMMGRTHGVFAQPTSLGLKMALWREEMLRNRQRLERARESISVGKISGAVGTYAHLDPRVEEYVCERLGLVPARVSTQVIQRDRHAELVSTLAIVGSSLEKFTTEIRLLQRTEVTEILEPFGRAQKGSSAMPHKRNPIVSERVSGLARVLRGHAQAAMENIALWHERDISHSSVERVILPDSTILLDYMLDRFAFILEGLDVRPDRMRENLESSKGLVFSGSVLLALAEAGMSREEAYRLVQRAAMKSWETGDHLKDSLEKDRRVTDLLSRDALDRCFDYREHLIHVPRILRRLGLPDDGREGGEF